MEWRALLLVGVLACGALVPTGVHASPARFLVGAASVDITPPHRTTLTDAAFVPACGPKPSLVQDLWPGPRRFAFTEPYRDLNGNGRYDVGEPFCDADGDGRFEAPYLAGGSGQDRWPLFADASDPVSAQALVFDVDGTSVGLVVVDSIGLFNTAYDDIRNETALLAPDVTDVFGASTHDESAPDPIGLWGPDGSGWGVPDPAGATSTVALTSGVDTYYMTFLTDRVAHALARADVAREPATLKLAVTGMPSNVQSCFSSYPYVDDQRVPILQAVAASDGHVIATLVNVGTHVETLAFSGVPQYTTMLSGDWPGRARATLQATYPGSVGIVMAGLVGSVETPTVYPEGTVVSGVPGALHDAPNPDGCSTVYASPDAPAVVDAQAFTRAYGDSIAHHAADALASAASYAPTQLAGARQDVCVQLENNLFAAAFAAGLFPTRPAYVDPTCTLGVAREEPTALGPTPPADLNAGAAPPMFVKTTVAALTVGPAQFVFSPGEVFPFTEIRGPLAPSEMPFPTDCWDVAADAPCAGHALPMTPWVVARMTTPHKFMAGLGEDMIGYLFPPGNFVGEQGQTGEQPWVSYHVQHDNSHDRFGHGHSDDAESLGPHASLAVTRALVDLLSPLGAGERVEPGLFVDAAGATSTSPFARAGFGGAVGVATPNGTFLVGRDATAFATFDGWPDAGAAGTSLPYSVSTAGVMLPDGRALLIDVWAASGGS